MKKKIEKPRRPHLREHTNVFQERMENAIGKSGRRALKEVCVSKKSFWEPDSFLKKTGKNGKESGT
ncbi:hypothetical protein CH379_003240 [Leptospira ellisii]|uniref:Uncharacterized protein n=1 Tax=Leptospira ellisii TaxID=2023197 RepID=A0AAE4QKD2_9LEPT|nr:hypothetical protein [Leptospira ellisii]MDV6234642.1 hypothetical protein [Leptospira ellisii]